MKKILILTADYGYGHRSTANAVTQALREMHGQECKVEIVNPLDDPRAPAFLHENQNDYDRLVREMPDLYKVGYQIGDTQFISRVLNTTWTVMLFNVLRGIIREKQPDVIVCTYLYFQGILSAVFASEKRHIPLLTIVTDLVVCQTSILG